MILNYNNNEGEAIDLKLGSDNYDLNDINILLKKLKKVKLFSIYRFRKRKR